MNTENQRSIPVDLKDITVTDSFWGEKMQTVREVVIPRQWELLNDRVPDAEASYCMHNFKAAGLLNKRKIKEGASFKAPSYTFRGFQTLPEDPECPEEDAFYGFVFQDTDFSKWIEAVGYTLTMYPNPELEKIADGAIDIVCEAQAENGYLDTYYILNGMDGAFTNLRDHHELYCLGHLIEGAVSYYQATGKDRLLMAACRFSDHVCLKFGPEEGKIHGYPGHEIAEMALFKLYEVTGKEAYRDLAEYFINERGQDPGYFALEHPEDKGFKKEKDYYHQAHLPVREQNEAVGHAVRAVYLYSGMADMARITGDETLYKACCNLWDSITREKLYITGGIGGTHIGEAFSYPFDLPNDTAYAETCASVGLVFFARRMLQIKPDRKYADVMELALYNTVLSGMASDGKSFFYVNPLEVLPLASRLDQRKSHVEPVRQKWFGCACCPPNIARLLSSLGSYAYTRTEDTLFVHLYMGGTVKPDRAVTVNIQSDLPDTGKVIIETDNPEGKDFTLALRIPSWCRDRYSIEGADLQESYFKDGYLYLKIPKAKTTITLQFEMKPVYIEASDRVREDSGKLAVMRGPVVYCLEEKDNGKDLHLLRFHPDNPFTEVKDESIFSERPVILKTKGFRIHTHGEEVLPTDLYHTYQAPEKEEVELTLIPYHLFANRGEGEMSVYLSV